VEFYKKSIYCYFEHYYVVYFNWICDLHKIRIERNWWYFKQSRF